MKRRRRWSVQQRLKFIDDQLHWREQINRLDLINEFGVSVPQASHDLSAYKSMAPKNMAYDASAKTYRRSNEFEPLYKKPSSSNYLRSLLSPSLGPQEAFKSIHPPTDAIPEIERFVDEEILRKIVNAILNSKSIYVYYQSTGRPSPRWRWISPHALATDRHRWHARAFCHNDQKFKDFTLARIWKTTKDKPSRIDVENDKAWNEMTEFRIGPHPSQSPEMQKTTERDFQMNDGTCSIKVRVSMSLYLAVELGFHGRTYRYPQLVLLNADEVNEARRACGEAPLLVTKEEVT